MTAVLTKEQEANCIRVRDDLMSVGYSKSEADRLSRKAALDANRSVGDVDVRRVVDIEAAPIRWLWPGRIARGKLTMVAGHPGLGKSLLSIAVAAVVSNGGRWPVDGTPCERGDVMIMSAEDDVADTIRPRLEAAGASLQRVEIINGVIDAFDTDGNAIHRPLNLKSDIAKLDALIAARFPHVAMLIIDPVGAYLGGTDSHVNSDVRALLAPLAALAAKYDVAIVLISHLNKGGSNADAMTRVTGSLAFVAAARAAYIVAKDPDNPARRLFLAAKNNLAKDAGGIAFGVEPVTLSNRIETSRILWEPEPVTISADEALAPSDPPADRSELDDAKRFLRALLEEGPVSSKEIRADAEGAGHAWATIRRAQQALGIEAHKVGLRGGWVWELPPKMLKSAEDAHDKFMGAFGQDEHLRGAANPYRRARDGDDEAR
jgi:putative DNA primase/helicase